MELSKMKRCIFSKLDLKLEDSFLFKIRYSEHALFSSFFKLPTFFRLTNCKISFQKEEII